VASGELDIQATPRLSTVLAMAATSPGGRLVLDLSEVTFIDSTGLALLLRTEAASRQDGFKLQIKRSPAAAVRSALEASGLERVLPFIDEDG